MTFLGSRTGPAQVTSPGQAWRGSALLLAFALLFLLSACRKKAPARIDARAITREMVSAAQQASGGATEIAIRPSGPGGAVPRSGTEDHIYVTLADPARLRALEDAFDEVARRHHLQREPRGSAPGVVRFDYRWGARLTQSIHIVTPQAKLSSPGPPAGRAGKPRLAIIIDDLGYDSAAADALLAIPFPLTVSVLPDLLHSSEIAEEAGRRGYQVLLHVPMQPSGDARQEAAELRVGMDQAEVTRLLSAMFETVPGAVGVNNHQGSLATADPRLMAEIMPVLRQRGLFFIDSRTTAATVAYQAAQRAGVRAAYRNVFLDDTPAPETIRRELQRAELLARRQGWSIAIGHPHPATLETLRQELPRLQAHGIHLVFASDLAR